MKKGHVKELKYPNKLENLDLILDLLENLEPSLDTKDAKWLTKASNLDYFATECF